MIALITESSALRTLINSKDELLVLAGNLLLENPAEIEQCLTETLKTCDFSWEHVRILSELDPEELRQRNNSELFRKAMIINYTRFISLCRQHTLIRSCF